MLINQTDFIATQVQQIVYPNITAITETGASITIQTKHSAMTLLFGRASALS